jgi:RHS repeat-associated protein
MEFGEQTTGGKWTVTASSPAKNLGGPFPLYAADCSSHATDPTPNAFCGNPINAATGNKFQVERDFTGAPVTGLALTRYYNSQDTTSSAFGAGWHSTWHRSLNPVSAGMVIVTRADGREDTFTINAGAWQADPDVTSRLTAVLNASSKQVGWQLVTADDTTETYSLAGLLTAITTRAGLTTSFTYNTSSELTAVTGPFGDALTFVSDSKGRVSQMKVPDGGIFAYAYDANDNLVSVTNPDKSVRKYVYGDTSFLHALTGIVDEDGNAFASWTYDTQGRAISSEHAGGADLTSVAYDTGISSVTDARGNTYYYALDTQFDMVKPTALSGVPDPTAAGQAFTYDGNGFLASETDYDGNVTDYTHDARGDQTSRTEAAGTAIARTISTAWLANFHLPSSITEPGRVTSFGYDARGNQLLKTITAGSLKRSWAYTYNGDGLVLSATNPLGAVTRFTYDSVGDVATMTDPLGHVTKFTGYDLDGRLLSMVDPNGLTTKFTYNFRGQMTSRTVGTEVTAYAYDAAGQLIKMTPPDGAFFAYTYDAAHRLTGIKDAAGDRIAFTRDATSNVVKVQFYNPSGTQTQTGSYTYDASNRLAAAIGALGQTTAYAYDLNSNLLSVTDPLKHVTGYRYDALNRLAQTINPAGGLTDYHYDALDHLISVIDPRDLTTSYTWNGLDDQTGVKSPDTGATARAFDAAGNAVTSVDARGLTTSYKYDALSRLIQAVYAGGGTVAWGYDQGTYGIGHLTSMTDFSGSTKWAYDQHGRVISKPQTIGAKTYTTSMDYDTVGRLADIAYPSGAVVVPSYDAAGRVSGLKSGTTALLSSVSYLPFGPPEAWAQGNGAIYSRSFDLDGRIAGIGLGSGTMAFAFDAASRITGITETGVPNKAFGYDALDRETGYTSSTTSLGYAYDANSNRTKVSGSSSIAYSFAAASNRLLDSTGGATNTFTYDADGSTTVDNKSVTILSYSYDATERMVMAKTGAYATAYTNDGLGERVSRSGYGASTIPGGEEAFAHDQAGHLLGEYDGTSKAIQETVWLGDLPVAVLMPGKPAYYISPDQLGAPHQIASATRNVVWHWDHDPFGNGTPTGTITYNLRFPGQYYNQETGLNYNGFRDYDPTTGRYVQSATSRTFRSYRGNTTWAPPGF